jgi:hypothetical protein
MNSMAHPHRPHVETHPPPVERYGPTQTDQERKGLSKVGIGSLIEGLRDAANNLEHTEGNLDVAHSFATEADMVLFKIRLS